MEFGGESSGQRLSAEDEQRVREALQSPTYWDRAGLRQVPEATRQAYANAVLGGIARILRLADCPAADLLANPEFLRDRATWAWFEVGVDPLAPGPTDYARERSRAIAAAYVLEAGLAARAATLRWGSQVREGDVAKHTEGPWSVTCERNRAGAYNTVGVDGAEWPQSEIAFVSCDNPDYAANQAVIVAAPDLLAACKAALPIVEDYFDGIDQDVTDAVLGQLQTAIAKAEGVKK